MIVKEVFRIVGQIGPEGISVRLVEQNVRVSRKISEHADVPERRQMACSGSASEPRAGEARIRALAGATAKEWKLEDLPPV